MLHSLSEWVHQQLGLELWLASLALIAVATAVANTLAQRSLRMALRASSDNLWADSVLSAARNPLLVAVWLVGLGLMLPIINAQVDFPFESQILQARNVGFVLCVSWFLVRLVRQFSHNWVENKTQLAADFDRTTADALTKLGVLAVWVVSIITLAQMLGLKIGGLLALGGVGGLAVGLAAKDLLANFFGGLTIYLDRPFTVGEWIRSPDKSIEGTVEYISWRHTRIRAFNKNPIYVPNAVFSTIVVENPSRMSHRRFRETIGLRYDDFAVVAPIVNDMRAMLQQHPGIDTTQTLIVNFNQFGASSLDILVYCFTKTTVWVEFHQIKEDVLLRMGQIIAAHGAQIAFPTQTLLVQGASSDEPLPTSALSAP
jgi:MscS family membrane protein